MTLLGKHRRSSGKVTLSHVAKLAGVGQMTVSRALRTPEQVSAELREKIQQAIETLGYVPNSAARELASNTSRNIVIVTPSITATENTLILNGLQKALDDVDIQLIILIAGKPNWLRELVNYSPSAVILINLNVPLSERNWIANSGLPCIEIGSKQRTPLGINVCVDVKSAVEMMIDYLIKQGYQEIGLLCARQQQAIFQQYLESWHKTLLSRFRDPQLILHSAEIPSFSGGAKLFNEALLTWDKVDALIFLSDELACGALFEAQRKHYAIPYKVAIAGLGGLEVSQAAYPTLTTIQIPYEQLGKIAGEKLKQCLHDAHHSLEKETIQLETRLIIRDSA
ncbi:GntR family transcriptional regulator [Rodentibacter genomosp. 1]|uniref:GntR family transcriptional regulator n=1 Tax=Rodentibacter genomosp. 1 TaxID=1908264 RepID=A0A1V3J0I7_9PAST|nr:LacI family DNA-binding transcriptional regulator [Rodentibacter genomosp. 1]OOF48438.1 GntR family transcriptional regulator [Rodentibacter genomosp. 1]